MKRREFITLVGAAWPLAARAQQPAMPVIGFLGSATAKQWAPLMGGFLEGLSEAEIVVGRDVTIEYRWAEGQYDRLPALAASLVQRQVSVIAALTTPSAVVKSQRTPTPFFASKNDPSDGAETGAAEPHIAEQSRSWRSASGEREVKRGS